MKRYPRLELTPGAAAMAGLWLCLDPGGLCPLFFAAAAVHELGHLLCLRLCRVPVLRLRLSAAGAELETGPMPPRQALLCAAAGPGANLLAGAALLRCAPRFSLLCWMLAGFNLLPVWPLDGGRMIRCVLLARLPITQAEHISEIVSFAACAVLLLIGVFLTFFRKSGLWPLGTAAYLTVRLLMLARRTDAVQ